MENRLQDLIVLLDFVLFTILMEEHQLKLTEEELSVITSCFHEAEKMAWSLEKDKVNFTF